MLGIIFKDPMRLFVQSAVMQKKLISFTNIITDVRSARELSQHTKVQNLVPRV